MGADAPEIALAVSGSTTLSIPNFITLGRILLVPVVFWLLVSGQTRAAFVCFLVAGISDAVDGFLAKRYHWQTELGAYLDPLADKVLIVSIFIALGVSEEIPLWLVVAVVARDIFIVAGVLLCRLLEHPMTIQPLAVSKANTAAQIALAGLVLADTGFSLGLGAVRWMLVLMTGLLTLLSLAAYMAQWLAHMRKLGDGDPPG